MLYREQKIKNDQDNLIIIKLILLKDYNKKITSKVKFYFLLNCFIKEKNKKN